MKQLGQQRNAIGNVIDYRTILINIRHKKIDIDKERKKKNERDGKEYKEIFGECKKVKGLISCR